MDSLPLKCHNSFQNLNNRRATDSFAPRPSIFKLQQEVLKFSDICVSWSSPKTDLGGDYMIPVGRDEILSRFTHPRPQRIFSL